MLETSTKLSRRSALTALSVAGVAPLSLAAPVRLLARERRQVTTPSGYGIEFSHALDDLIGDLAHGDRGDPKRESAWPHADWYTHHARRRFGAWGPKARRYAPLDGLETRSIEWIRERVIATAARFLGYGYQHHHIPDWGPPADWPWKETCVGHNGKGVDCSNFTSFVYNQGFGIKMTSEIDHQAHVERALEGQHDAVSIRAVALPKEYDQRLAVLRTGDLLYVRGREDGPITHVVLWVGPLGRAESGSPLVIDSHGSGVKDDWEQPIPCGIQLRPFREPSWYNRCASHAHRIFHEPRG
ncbi:MAG: C40 family peptidase [Planctomycetia bacterium]|nr:C40 family peptidase [Planctomycetia bacterium]